MRTHSFTWNRSSNRGQPAPAACDADVVFYFGSRGALSDRTLFSSLREAFPKANLMGCSTGGQIGSSGLADEPIVGLALSLERSRVRVSRQPISRHDDSYAAGASLAIDLNAPDLAGLVVLTDGLKVNGGNLAAGIASVIPPGIPVAGGMAGDDNRFESTLVGANCSPTSGVVAAAAFYGEHISLRASHGGGWSAFGPRRSITRSAHNVLYELDGRPALELYTKYLGSEANQLPASGLRFPVLIRDPRNSGKELIRTLLSVDRATGSITFAGNMPEGWTAQLMRASSERLRDAACQAAGSLTNDIPRAPDAALLVSCIGRRMYLGQRTDDEIEAVRDSLGGSVPVVGFYSYGEFAPLAGGGHVELHNQTMTVLTVTENPL